MLGHRTRLPVRRQAQCGLSLVELMVGLAVGLFVVAGAATLVTTQLGDNRRLLLETQLQQDLRSSADIIARDLRRAGYVDNADAGVWAPALAAPAPNRNNGVTVSGTDQVEYKYRRFNGANENYGFKLDSSTRALKIKIDAATASWQDLTDARTMRVESLSIAADNAPQLILPCPKLCLDGTDSCWPRIVVRGFVVDIEGRAVSDNTVRRKLRTQVRLRNDWVRFVDPTAPICPI